MRARERSIGGRGTHSSCVAVRFESGVTGRSDHSARGCSSAHRLGATILALVPVFIAALLSTCSVALAAPPEAPQVEESFVSDVAGTSATISAKLNPGGAATTYTFEYAPAGGAFAPVPGSEATGSLPEGTTAVPLSAHVQGLLAHAAYQVRLRAVNSVESVTGEAIAFTTQPSAPGPLLPDGRQWEMVSPPNKHAALLEPILREGVIQAAANGSALTYYADAPIGPGSAGYTNQTQLLSTRGAAGWTSKDISLSHPSATGAYEGVGTEYRYFSEDLAQAGVQPTGAFTPLSPEASEQTPYLRSNFADGSHEQICPTLAQQEAGISCFRALVTSKAGYEDVPPGTVFGKLGDAAGGLGTCPDFAPFCGPIVVGATTDASHVLLNTSTIHVALTTTPAPEGGLYEWSGGKLTLISVLPASEGGAASQGFLGNVNNRNTRNAVSENGARVFWTGPDLAGQTHLYRRDAPTGETIQMDEGLTGSPIFQIASTDGSRVFFIDESNLYECRIVERHCERSLLGSAVQGSVIGASEDGEWVYFAANSMLAPSAVAGACDDGFLVPGATCNLYVRHGGTTRLVAILSSEDFNDWGRAVAVEPQLPYLTARVSPDGQWLAFTSHRSLTAYDNHDAVSGKPDQEVYLYSARAQAVSCASCNPTGARPVGEEVNGHLSLVRGEQNEQPGTWLTANVPGWTPNVSKDKSLYQSRYLSNSGRLFFNGRDALVPQDANGTWDVYEYEPPGVGACTSAAATFSARSGGCVGLISGGSSGEESAFLDASATGGRDTEGAEGGGDVFFLTSAKLATQDFDTTRDVYDAHECTDASPCLPPSPAQPASCTTGDSCKAAPTTQPTIFAAPPSTNVSGLGNLAPVAALKPASRPPSAARLKAAQLAKALKSCRAKRAKRKRHRCESQARRRYGPIHGEKARRARQAARKSAVNRRGN